MIGANASIVGISPSGMPITPKHHCTADVYFEDEEAEFLKAMDAFKRESGKRFPTWTEALAVLKRLGWERHITVADVIEDKVDMKLVAWEHWDQVNVQLVA